MARNNHMPEVIGNRHVTLFPREEYHSDNPNPKFTSNDDIILSVDISTDLSAFASHGVIGRRRTQPLRQVHEHFSAASLRDGAARAIVIGALSNLGIAGAATVSVTDMILRCLAGKAATWRPDEGARIRTLRVVAIVHDFADEPPLAVEEEDDILGIDLDEEIRFVPASRESVEGLVKETTEKAVTCTVCLDEAPVGSEVTRLPCSHGFHGKCIVQWLGRSKFCPACRFELP